MNDFALKAKMIVDLSGYHDERTKKLLVKLISNLHNIVELDSGTDILDVISQVMEGHITTTEAKKMFVVLCMKDKGTRDDCIKSALSVIKLIDTMRSEAAALRSKGMMQAIVKGNPLTIPKDKLLSEVVPLVTKHPNNMTVPLIATTMLVLSTQREHTQKKKAKEQADSVVNWTKYGFDTTFQLVTKFKELKTLIS